MLNVKIDPADKADLEAAARRLGVSLSEFVRQELRASVARLGKRKPPAPWDLLKAYSGKYQTTDPELSTRSARAAIKARHRAKRAR
jgi:hypothetical protein